MVDIVVAAIAAVGMLLCQILISWRQNNLILYRIEQLEKKQDVHNGYIKRMYKMEERVAQHDSWLSDLEHKVH